METFFLESTDSTNRIAKKHAESGAAHGTAVIAEKQTKGRGRLGKEWQSVPGKGLYCSIIVRPKVELDQLAQVTLVAGLAVAKVLEGSSGKICQLKWPNDIIFRGKKCGGILAETVGLIGADDLEKSSVIIGIGLNVNSKPEDFPEFLRGDVTSLLLETAKKWSITELFDLIRKQLLLEVGLFEKGGFSTILEQWRARDFLLGKHLECVGHDGAVIKGVALGPDNKGRLHLRGEDGREHEVLSGDLRLAGLIQG
jgi:BirA family biotin operon repressor/biotin-[acetyl-CoA-carboxylase] ligase